MSASRETPIAPTQKEAEGLMEPTRGPWVIRDISDQGAFTIVGGETATEYVCDGQPWITRLAGKGLANARLIAAAPELLEAARSLLVWSNRIPHQMGQLKIDLSADLDAAREAIFKAEGRQ